MNNLQRKHKNKVDYNSQVYHENFIKLYPELRINQVLHTTIIKTFFSIVIRKMINEMYKFQLPGLGKFYITKQKQKIVKDKEGNITIAACIDWKETRKVRELTGDKTKKVKFLNNHTNGYIYSIEWDKKNSTFTNNYFYSFIPSDSFKHKLAQAIFSSVKPLNAYAQ